MNTRVIGTAKTFVLNSEHSTIHTVEESLTLQGRPNLALRRHIAASDEPTAVRDPPDEPLIKAVLVLTNKHFAVRCQCIGMELCKHCKLRISGVCRRIIALIGPGSVQSRFSKAITEFAQQRSPIETLQKLTTASQICVHGFRTLAKSLLHKHTAKLVRFIYIRSRRIS